MKKILVTGASSGIGEATVKLLSKDGLKVTAVARRIDRLNDLSKLTGCEAMQLDVRNKEALKELERFYGFDKPIYQRYLSWLGIWPREIKHRNFTLKKPETYIEK